MIWSEGPQLFIALWPFSVPRFMFETPFTRRGPDGKVTHGDVSCQWKVKTILTTEACFPYLKTRIKVVAREDLELTPIQVLAWLLDCLGLIYLWNACWPAHSGFNWRSWAQIGEVGNCLRPTCKSYNAPGSVGPRLIDWKKPKILYNIDMSITHIAIVSIWIPNKLEQW